MDNCLFCKIIAGEIPSRIVYEDNNVFAFRDINPQMCTHILVIPKEHIVSAGEVDSGNSTAVAHCFEAISKIAKQEKLESGFRIISNCGEDAGQTVFHLHFHILSGGTMGERLVP